MAQSEFDDMLDERARLGDLSWARPLNAPVTLEREISQDALGWIISGELAAADELVELGYLDDAHEPTEAGEWLQGVFSPEENLSFRIFAKRAGVQSAFFVGFDSRAAFVAIGVADSWSIGYFALQEIPDVIARWLGVSPAWTFDVLKEPLSNGDFEAAIAGTLTVEPGAELSAMVGTPWAQFALQFGFGESIEFVSIDGWGLFVVDRPSEDSVHLAPVVPGDFYVQLITGLLETLGVDNLPERVEPA
jgi:hypothetical protein